MAGVIHGLGGIREIVTIVKHLLEEEDMDWDVAVQLRNEKYC